MLIRLAVRSYKFPYYYRTVKITQKSHLTDLEIFFAQVCNLIQPIWALLCVSNLEYKQYLCTAAQSASRCTLEIAWQTEVRSCPILNSLDTNANNPIIPIYRNKWSRNKTSHRHFHQHDRRQCRKYETTEGDEYLEPKDIYSRSHFRVLFSNQDSVTPVEFVSKTLVTSESASLGQMVKYKPKGILTAVGSTVSLTSYLQVSIHGVSFSVHIFLRTIKYIFRFSKRTCPPKRYPFMVSREPSLELQWVWLNSRLVYNDQ